MRQTRVKQDEIARAAAPQDMTVSFEYHRNPLTEEVDDMVALLRAAGADNLFTYWQPVPGRGQPR